MENNYYWSDDWSEEFYVELAYAGFITTTYEVKRELVLLPEIQFDYAVLDFEKLHISKKVQKLLKEDRFIFTLNEKVDEVLQKLDTYHEQSWVVPEYADLLKRLYGYRSSKRNFELVSVELSCKQSGDLISGEIGYVIGNTYTSLTGFSSREKRYNNCGSLQLVLLAQHLKEENFEFWNLGHPHMEYKKRLGAKTYGREEFLKRWIRSRDSDAV